MKISVLGGGSEIGASCLHIQIGATSLIVDAGMRVHGEELMPAIGMLDHLNKPDAILVTHAHADHIGALPVIHRIYPDVPIFATPPTADLMQIMMRDSFKIMTQRCMEARMLIPYTKEQMEETLRAVRLFPASGQIAFGETKVTLHRAGHILGAVMFSIEGDGEKLLVSGDLSFKAGRTIPGAEVPIASRPDALIIESTYGNREHSDRNTEEKRLADNVAEVIAGGGFALIPAFALGRAQEVLLILQDYMDRGLIPRFPIYVDGLVTPISKIYRRYPQYLKGPVAHRIRVHGDAFLTEGRCIAVKPKDREQVLKGKPACIVASSGMLIGGASVWYAERLVNHEKNAIFITGYQDEESPGRKLLSLAEGESRELELNGTVHQVRCRVGKYGLSAHGDAGELLRFISMVRPAKTLIVHGDDDARLALNERIEPRHHPVLTENGELYTVSARAKATGSFSPGKNSRHQPLKEKVGQLLLYKKEADHALQLALCTGFYPKTQSLTCRTPKGEAVRLSLEQVCETIGPWNRSFDLLQEEADAVFTFSRPFLQTINWENGKEGRYPFESIAAQVLPEDDLKPRLALALALQSLPEDSRKVDEGKTTYTLTREHLNRLAHLDLPIQAIKMNATKAMDYIRNMLSDDPHFIRCGADALGTADEHLTLYFDFPAIIDSEKRADLSHRIKEGTGWFIHFSDSVRVDRLQKKIHDLFGTSGSASVYLDQRTASLPVKRPHDADSRLQQLKDETGFSLIFKGEQNHAAVPGQADNQTDFYRSEAPSPRLENNQGIHEAGVWAKERGITLYKASMKQSQGKPYMEVHFVTPEIARRHETDMEELSWRTGLPVTYAKNPKQNEIIRMVSEHIPDGWGMKKNPSLHIAQTEVMVKLSVQPPEDELQHVCDEIDQLTGYRLIVEVR
ncbi:MBL fold metallo-hydrolase [Sporolactobacillus sp. THM19-2]|uniref:MBL fold metallo-hydrolase n=1 Tax=Sporolactobacillus sp. THM19-2 TaxID=2511171 RepID=UPI0010224760|nr:MBL fold metallo-hydrolase [Sporolactobacillus sp. THM19-2]RYL88143.1 MBL fold metallo-hydrolase [Sporolactobacillus sp. THM19-2]